MPAKTFQLIKSHTVTGSATNGFNFTNIPQTYTDLHLKIYASDTNTGSMNCAPNGDTTANKSRTNLYVNSASSSGASGGASGNTQWFFDIGTAGYKGVTTVDFLSYTNTSRNRTIIWRWANGNASTSVAAHGFWVATWANKSAITSLNFSSDNGANTIEVGSTFKLYGIKAE